MKTTLVLLLILYSAVSALSSAEDNMALTKTPRPLSPAQDFKPNTTTKAPTTTTITPKPTNATTIPPKPTNATTIPPKPTTTTTIAPKPTNATTIAPKPTNATTIAPKPTNATTIPPKPTNATTIPPKPTNATTIAPKPTNATTIPPKPTNATTIAPKTTASTTKAPTPPKPTPVANVTVGNYSLKTDKGVMCLMAHMALQIQLTGTKVNGNFTVQPQLTKTSGFCQADKANLTLSFKEGTITFMFIKNTTEKSVYVNTLSFDLNYPLSSSRDQSSFHANNNSVHLFAAKIGHSYSCKNGSVYMGNGLYLDVTKSRMQAFNVTGNDFGSADFCTADQPDYRVAIAVGVTLLILIIIVVVAYLLGRRRRAGGYQPL